MSKSKHSPGPWYAEPLTKDSASPGAIMVSSETKFDPMEVLVLNNGGDYTPERQAADARLIASAPELLALLNRGLETGVFNEIPVFKHHVVTLVEKITGGSNE